VGGRHRRAARGGSDRRARAPGSGADRVRGRAAADAAELGRVVDLGVPETSPDAQTRELAAAHARGAEGQRYYG
jgi:hypothetical protein